MIFLRVPVEYGIIIMIAPDSIHPHCFALYYKISLNILVDFDSTLNNSGSLRMALLKSLIPVVDV